jgi:hypothetical protein
LRDNTLLYFLSSAAQPRDLAVKVARLYRRDRWRFSPRRLDRLVDLVPLDRPIFLLGVAGCGGTLIGRSLRRHGSVVSMSGNADDWTGIDELGVVRNRLAALPRTLWGNKFRTDIEHAVQGTNHFFASDDLLPAYRMTERDATPADAERLVRLLREHVAVYAREPGHARFLDKTHANTVKVSLLAELLAGRDPHFVLVARSPYACCPWLARRKPPSFRVELPWERRLELAAEHWANAYATALEDGRRTANFTVIRFEDWLADPDAMVRRLCAAVGLEFDDAMVPGSGQPFPFATLRGDRKWYPLYRDERAADIPPRDVEIIDRRCGAIADELGYERPPVSTASASPYSTASSGERKRSRSMSCTT